MNRLELVYLAMSLSIHEGYQWVRLINLYFLAIFLFSLFLFVNQINHVPTVSKLSFFLWVLVISWCLHIHRVNAVKHSGGIGYRLQYLFQSLVSSLKLYVIFAMQFLILASVEIPNISVKLLFLPILLWLFIITKLF